MDQYDSFMVRIWRRRNSGDHEWIGRVEHIQEHQTHRFHDPEELLTYLREQFAPAPAMTLARRGGSTRISGAHSNTGYAAGTVDPGRREPMTLLDPKAEDPARH